MPVFHVEMRWRCDACRTENLGRYKVCQHCTKPKDKERFYDAPETQAPSVGDAVTDPDLVAMATAGADWACRFCGAHQRRQTGECANCGATEGEAAKVATYDRPTAPTDVSPPPSWLVSVFSLWYRLPRVWAIVLGVAAVLGAILFFVFRSHVVEASVVERTWTHTVVVERYQIVPGEGFAESRPAEAFDVRNQGQRHHHDDKVQDGTTRESYSEQVACGEDCRTTPVVCTENDNGFKTCSGGDEVCSTKYCSETRYRDVPRYKNVPVYRDWFSWRAWQWKDQRSLVEAGAEDEPRWPTDAQIDLGAGCGEGEKERTRRETRYEVVFEDEDAQRHTYRARDIDEFSSLSPGTTKKIRFGRSQETEIVEQE